LSSEASRDLSVAALRTMNFRWAVPTAKRQTFASAPTACGPGGRGLESRRSRSGNPANGAIGRELLERKGPPAGPKGDQSLERGAISAPEHPQSAGRASLALIHDRMGGTSCRSDPRSRAPFARLEKAEVTGSSPVSTTRESPANSAFPPGRGALRSGADGPITVQFFPATVQDLAGHVPRVGVRAGRTESR
jgi:hypothetical protein